MHLLIHQAGKDARCGRPPNANPAQQLATKRAVICDENRRELNYSPRQRWRRHPDLNWGMKVLQTFALPLGHVAVFNLHSDYTTNHVLTQL